MNLKHVAAAAALALAGVLALARAQEGTPPMKRENRLARARSPYLLQHKDNPVDWYEWGDEAFEKARREQKPIFLSVGYSACHWCHVMEHESFEDEATAKALNDRFVSIKVDREERPDVDEVYMRVTQMLTSHGGWPMTVFMTPDKKPFFAGTYFPKDPRPGMITFGRLLEKIDDVWRNRRADVLKSADEISHAASSAESKMPAEAGALDPKPLVEATIQQLARRFDESNGGFGGAPKFPPHQALRLFLDEKDPSGEARKMALLTLERMAAGGIHDHVGGGFARYATDEEWHVPHFEKMLYDNAMLARSYVDAYALSKDERLRDVAQGIFRWLGREMTDPAGGFFSAYDADSEGVEGKFYCWTPTQVADVLGKADAGPFCRAYDITESGNWEDGQSIPRLTRSGADPKPFAAAREKLYAARAKRVWPGLDDKVLTSWNGLAIGALARGAQVLGDPALRAAAERAARFFLEKMRGPDGRLHRTWRKGDAGIKAYLEDYAFLADGLIDLHEATGNPEWLKAARDLADRMLADYEDKQGGGFYFTAHDAEALLFRSKDPFDGAIPSGNGVAARALVRLGRITGDKTYTDAADRLFRAFAGSLAEAPHGMITLVQALAMRGGISGTTPTALAEAGPVTVTATIEGSPAAAGATVTAVIEVGIARGYHVAAPIAGLAVTSRDIPVEAGPPHFPDPEALDDAFEGAPDKAYHGKVTIRVPVRIKPHATVGVGKVRIALKYQACNDRECLAPVEVKVDAELQVTP
jgi:uncharacterized protein YyaL (SSP411 family)